MLGNLVRLILKITLGGIIIGGVAAVLGLGAIAVSEYLSRRKDDEFDDEFADFEDPRFGASAQDLDEEFLSLLACPVCKTGVRREADYLVCDTCSRRYPIRDGIPVMLVEEAEMPQAGAKTPE
jgi:uncharacterized protein YbaR (Trm112 family)